jgi:hypothetical protein
VEETPVVQQRVTWAQLDLCLFDSTGSKLVVLVVLVVAQQTCLGVLIKITKLPGGTRVGFEPAMGLGKHLHREPPWPHGVQGDKRLHRAPSPAASDLFDAKRRGIHVETRVYLYRSAVVGVGLHHFHAKKRAPPVEKLDGSASAGVRVDEVPVFRNQDVVGDGETARRIANNGIICHGGAVRFSEWGVGRLTRVAHRKRARVEPVARGGVAKDDKATFFAGRFVCFWKLEGLVFSASIALNVQFLKAFESRGGRTNTPGLKRSRCDPIGTKTATKRVGNGTNPNRIFQGLACTYM